MEEKLLQYLRKEYPLYENKISQLESWLLQESIVLESCDLTTSDEVLNKIRQLIPISENAWPTIRQILRNTPSNMQNSCDTRRTQGNNHSTQMTQSNAQQSRNRR